MVSITQISRILEGDFNWQRDISILATDLISMNWFFQRWGIYSRNGRSVVEFDNVVAIEYKKDFNLLDYPVERGAFESYNKVQIPYDVRVTFSSGGNLANRSALIQSIEELSGDLELYDVVTPEITVTNCNISHFDWRRADGRAGLVLVTVWLTEVRSTVYAEYDSSEITSQSGLLGSSFTAEGTTSLGSVEAINVDTNLQSIGSNFGLNGLGIVSQPSALTDDWGLAWMMGN